MVIDLAKIPQVGEVFNITEASDKAADLISGLSDLISGPFTLELKIQPMDFDYYLTGRLLANHNTSCSFCAIDYPLSLNIKLDEFFVTDKKRKAQKVAVVQGEEDRVYEDEETEPITGLKNEELDLTAYLHEEVGLSIPFQVPCKEAKKESCDNYIKCKKFSQKYENTDDFSKTKPFADLDKLSIDKKQRN